LIRYEGMGMPLNNRYKDNNAKFSADFVCATSSAILLSFALAFPEFWLISLALVPFLWRLCHVSLRGAFSLGAMLATFFVCATSMSDLILAPKLFLIKLLWVNITFVTFGLIINRAKKHVGFDPVFVALLWFPMQYILIRYVKLGDIFSISHSGSRLVIGFYSLIGILLGSLVILLSNSLILLFLKYLAQKIFSLNTTILGCNKGTYLLLDEVILEERWYHFPDVRASPWT